ncbi:MAG: RraA family protein [Bacilli bacterium]
MIYVGEKPENWVAQLGSTFQKVSPSTIGHMTDTGFMKGLHSLSGGKLVGRAITVKIPHLDSAAVHVAVNELEPGDVLVVDMNGDFDRASVGGIVAYAANVRKAAGIIVDGGITDIEEIRALDGLKVYYRTVSALTTRALGIEGAVHVPVSIGGAIVMPGDLILGDESGVMVLRGSGLAELAKMAYEKEQGEVRTKQQLDTGIPLMQLSATDQFVQTKRS